MNKQQTSGIGKQIKGGVKEAAATLTGNTAGKIEGKVEKAVGKAQTKFGNDLEKSRRENARRNV